MDEGKHPDSYTRAKLESLTSQGNAVDKEHKTFAVRTCVSCFAHTQSFKTKFATALKKGD